MTTAKALLETHLRPMVAPVAGVVLVHDVGVMSVAPEAGVVDMVLMDMDTDTARATDDAVDGEAGVGDVEAHLEATIPSILWLLLHRSLSQTKRSPPKMKISALMLTSLTPQHRL